MMAENEQPYCARCDSSGWVCENHDDVAWEGGAATCCDGSCGAGMPCPDCNNELGVMPRGEPGWRVEWTAKDGWAH